MTLGHSDEQTYRKLVTLGEARVAGMVSALRQSIGTNQQCIWNNRLLGCPIAQGFQVFSHHLRELLEVLAIAFAGLLPLLEHCCNSWDISQRADELIRDGSI